MPDVPVHGPACQGVESVVEEAAVDAMGGFVGAAKARSGAWGLRWSPARDRFTLLAWGCERSTAFWHAKPDDRRLASRTCSQTGGLSSSY